MEEKYRVQENRGEDVGTRYGWMHPRTDLVEHAEHQQLTSPEDIKFAL